MEAIFQQLGLTCSTLLERFNNEKVNPHVILAMSESMCSNSLRGHNHERSNLHKTTVQGQDRDRDIMDRTVCLSGGLACMQGTFFS